MTAVLRALEARAAAGDPIRVGLVGAGYAGRGFAARIIRRTPGIELVAIANRTIAEAERAYREAGVDASGHVSSAADLDVAIRRHRPVITDDPTVLTDAVGIEAIVEATGEVEFGAGVAVRAIDAGKHLILINAELDSCLGPLLKARADAAGVVLTDMAGDQPAVIMDLVDEVRLLGFRPILAGNIKSLLDHKRTPETQRAFAEAHGQRPKMITSFADGTKIAAEMGVVANATGFGVAERGMLGPRAERVEQAPERFDIESLLERPIVDYLLGAEPSFGVFVLGHEEDPLSQAYMKFYKMGEGPVYTFYRPFHLGPFETVQSGGARRAVEGCCGSAAGRTGDRGHRPGQAGPGNRREARRDRRVHRVRDAGERRHRAAGAPAADGAGRWRRARPRCRRGRGVDLRRRRRAGGPACHATVARAGRALPACDGIGHPGEQS